MEEGVLYGMQKLKGQLNKVIIPKEQIKEIHQNNEEASAGLSIVTGAVVLVAVITVVGVAIW